MGASIDAPFSLVSVRQLRPAHHQRTWRFLWWFYGTLMEAIIMNMNSLFPQPVALNINHLDVIDLAERCELLTDILVDSENPTECRLLCQYLYAHLDALKENLDKPLPKSRIEQLSVNDASEFPESPCFADSDDLCDYSQAVIQLLLCRSLPHDATLILNGLLMRLVNTLVDDLKTPRFLHANVQVA